MIPVESTSTISLVRGLCCRSYLKTSYFLISGNTLNGDERLMHQENQYLASRIGPWAHRSRQERLFLQLFSFRRVSGVAMAFCRCVYPGEDHARNLEVLRSLSVVYAPEFPCAVGKPSAGVISMVGPQSLKLPPGSIGERHKSMRNRTRGAAYVGGFVSLRVPPSTIVGIGTCF